MTIINKLKPEQKTEIILWSWLSKSGNYISKIYFNRKNILNMPIFNTTGINEKPDFIICFDRGYGKEYTAIEIKASDKSRDVHDSGKILKYYENYIAGKTKYFIENKEEIEIKHFSVMTENSIDGHLFKEETEAKDNLKNDNDTWRKTNAGYQLIPQYEYIRTSDFLRRLWADWRILKERLKINKDLPSIGIIISNPLKDKFPYLFTMIYTDWLENKSWKQRFWKL